MAFGEPIAILPSLRRSGVTEPAPIRWLLIAAAAGFLGLFVLVPLLAVFATALRAGLGRYAATILHPDARSAIALTLLTAAIVVPLNALFWSSAGRAGSAAGSTRARSGSSSPSLEWCWRRRSSRCLTSLARS